jgi:hypothetical protein
VNTNSLDEQYLDWLIARVTSPRQRRSTARTFWKLLKQFHEKEFFWFIPNDDNRILDGLELRNEFLSEIHYRIGEEDEEWASAGCSVLELLIGLSHRLSDLDGGEPRIWFWQMIKNLGLDQFDDQIPYDWEDVDEALSALIYRTYDRDGTGGLFPLTHPEEDQRKVEIWYQLNAYLLERE